MARKGENIYKRKDGRWEARYEKGRNSNGRIIYGSLYGKSYREVREKKVNVLLKFPVVKTVSPSVSKDICYISTRWLESIQHTVKESTYSCYLTLIQKHILTYFKNDSLITSEHIQQFINYKITNGLSPTSVRNIVVLLERILRYGEDEKYAIRPWRIRRTVYDKLIKRNPLHKIIFDEVDYNKFCNSLMQKEYLEKENYYYSAVVDWDNTPRKGKRGWFMKKASPEMFQIFMRQIYKKTVEENKPLIFIFAWNEWGEGAYLEPDLRNGYNYLEALKKVVEED